MLHELKAFYFLLTFFPAGFLFATLVAFEFLADGFFTGLFLGTEDVCFLALEVFLGADSFAFCAGLTPDFSFAGTFLTAGFFAFLTQASLAKPWAS